MGTSRCFMLQCYLDFLGIFLASPTFFRHKTPLNQDGEVFKSLDMGSFNKQWIHNKFYLIQGKGSSTYLSHYAYEIPPFKPIQAKGALSRAASAVRLGKFRPSARVSESQEAREKLCKRAKHKTFLCLATSQEIGYTSSAWTTKWMMFSLLPISRCYLF